MVCYYFVIIWFLLPLLSSKLIILIDSFLNTTIPQTQNITAFRSLNEAFRNITDPSNLETFFQIELTNTSKSSDLTLSISDIEFNNSLVILTQPDIAPIEIFFSKTSFYMVGSNARLILQRINLRIEGNDRNLFEMDYGASLVIQVRFSFF